MCREPSDMEKQKKNKEWLLEVVLKLRLLHIRVREPSNMEKQETEWLLEVVQKLSLEQWLKGFVKLSGFFEFWRNSG